MYYPDLSAFGVDNDRLKSQRLSRLQQAMKEDDLAALMLTDWLNIRYATNSVFMINLRATAIQRFVLVPQSGGETGPAPLLIARAGKSMERPHAEHKCIEAPVATRD
ncbi:MAG TPA: aminopeptidase P family N-terminal domain-containing protein, partial [Candidatus Binatia bacterium]|nr:aminopeptidase P family N-terminal domain-containing protein [Candidatus Binatia bacterium]